MVSYNESIHYDRIIFAQDISGSVAYARANLDLGLLTRDEFAAIEHGFEQILEEWKTDKFHIVQGTDEDVHTANERRLGEVIGSHIAGKLHTGRSRNDQVVTGMRMWLRDRLRETEKQLIAFLQVITSRARSEIAFLMPGYTHLQRAQPIRWSEWLLSYGSVFRTDLERLRQVIERVNLSPLGSGALAGNAFGINREAMAKELGFEGVTENAMAAVADRDFVIETLQWAAIVMQHFSRWSEDLIIYSTTEFGFTRMSDSYCAGSSLMPQKRNPDSLEQLRGKAAKVFGNMAGLMMATKGLPSTYNRDLQESWEPMLDTVKTTSDSIQIATGTLSTMTVYPDQMRAALSPDMLATDLADSLVGFGVPFREAHHICGRVVALAEAENKSMDQLTVEQFKEIDMRFPDDILSYLDYARSVDKRTSTGGTSEKSVLQQIERMEKLLEGSISENRNRNWALE